MKDTFTMTCWHCHESWKASRDVVERSAEVTFISERYTTYRLWCEECGNISPVILDNGNGAKI